jgi:hypothetical protein
MFIDIDKLSSLNGDMAYRSDQLRKGENLLKTQVGKLSYLSNFGIDLAYFIESPISFQNEVLQAHISERLSMNYLVVSNYEAQTKGFFDEHNIKITQTEASDALY